MKRASQFKKSQTAVLSHWRYFTLSVVCLLVECTRRQHKGNSKKKHLIIVGRLGWKWIERSVLQLLLLKQKEVELLGLHHVIELYVDDPIFSFLHLFFAKNALIFSTYFMQLIVLILPKIILSVRNNFTNDEQN